MFLFTNVIHFISIMTMMVFKMMCDAVSLSTLMQALILATSSTCIAAISIRLSFYFDVHPDNVTIPIVCAAMDIVASLSFVVIISNDMLVVD
jgi:cation transporter-like permease